MYPMKPTSLLRGPQYSNARVLVGTNNSRAARCFPIRCAHTSQSTVTTTTAPVETGQHAADGRNGTTISSSNSKRATPVGGNGVVVDASVEVLSAAPSEFEPSGFEALANGQDSTTRSSAAHAAVGDQLASSLIVSTVDSAADLALREFASVAVSYDEDVLPVSPQSPPPASPAVTVQAAHHAAPPADAPSEPQQTTASPLQAPKQQQSPPPEPKEQPASPTPEPSTANSPVTTASAPGPQSNPPEVLASGYDSVANPESSTSDSGTPASASASDTPASSSSAALSTGTSDGKARQPEAASEGQADRRHNAGDNQRLAEDVAAADAAVAAAVEAAVEQLDSAAVFVESEVQRPQPSDIKAGAVIAFTEVVNHDPYTLVRRSPMADGMMEVTSLDGTRMLRVWLPPGYSRNEAGPHGYPTLYLNDGQNLFDASLSLSGHSWEAAEAASELIASGQVPPFVIVGIDNSGVTRSYDYLPYKPGSGPGGVRKDAANWPGGGIDEYFEKVIKEVLPWAQKEYKLATKKELMAFGGSSFGGINALYMGLKFPEVFGALLVESPSLWFANEKCLLEDLPAHEGPWPARTFVAMGTTEYSGVRADKEADFDARLAKYVPQVVDILKGFEGVEQGGVKAVVDEGATHNEKAWADRLPGALKFLLSPWWGELAAAHAGELYFVAPRRLKAGSRGVLVLNKKRSRSLANAASVRIHIGFNYNWEVAPTKVDMKAAEWGPGAAEAGWMVGTFQIPEAAYEMHFVFSDGSQSVWDNNGGNNFYARIKALAPNDFGNTAEEIIASAARAADAPADNAAQSNQGVLFFTKPDVAIAGAPLRIYFNRGRSCMHSCPNVQLHYGFNKWQDGGKKEALKPTSLWRAEGVDWWSMRVDVPADAEDMSFAFSDGGTLWESNNSQNYHITVRDPHRKRGVPREIESCISLDHAGGTMDIITLQKKKGLNRRSRWTEEKILRVWTPPGFNTATPPEGGWPVLVMNDGQNLFEDWLAHQGVSWRVGFTAAELIEAGEVPPFVVVAIDSAGPMRSLNYLPYPPGTGQGGFRGDAERWPGGGVDDYMRRVTEELMPLVTKRYGLATDSSRIAFAGGSFGGVCSLYAAMHYPDVFGSVLVESPSLWIAEGAFLRDMAAFSGELPERIFMAWGTREYSATRDHARPDVDQLLLSYYRQAHWILGTKGMRGARMQTLEEQGAGHHELAWQWRLSGALKFLLGPWRSF